jgi:hypothetical protein
MVETTTAIAKPPYLDWDNLEGRERLLMNMWDGERWHAWRPDPDGDGVIAVPVSDVVEMDYLAKEAARAGDVQLRWFEFMFQRAYYPDLAWWIDGVTTDVRNLAASLAKIDFFFEKRAEIVGVNRFVETEVEYIVGVCRSMFDLLHEVSMRLWAMTEAADGSALQKRELPKRLSRIALHDDRPATQAEIIARHKLPPQLAAFYGGIAPFFSQLRRCRDLIHHKGHDAPRIVTLPRGFAIERSSQPFLDFGVWKDEHLHEETLASIRPPLAFMVERTLIAFEFFERITRDTVQFPPEIAPGYHVFIRGAHTPRLAALRAMMHEDGWWARS